MDSNSTFWSLWTISNLMQKTKSSIFHAVGLPQIYFFRLRFWWRESSQMLWSDDVSELSFFLTCGFFSHQRSIKVLKQGTERKQFQWNTIFFTKRKVSIEMLKENNHACKSGEAWVCRKREVKVSNNFWESTIHHNLDFEDRENEKV